MSHENTQKENKVSSYCGDEKSQDSVSIQRQSSRITVSISRRYLRDCLVFMMGIPILIRRYLYRETAPGGRLNKKDGLTRYGDSHVKDKTS